MRMSERGEMTDMMMKNDQNYVINNIDLIIADKNVINE